MLSFLFIIIFILIKLKNLKIKFKKKIKKIKQDETIMGISYTLMSRLNFFIR